MSNWSVRGLEGFLGDVLSVDWAQPARPGPRDVLDTVRAVASGRWRRSALSERSRLDLVDKVTRAHAARQPLTFSVPFGAYKSWRIHSHPMPNWAEVFALSHLRKYMESISHVYPYGAVVEFSYLSGVMDLVSNQRPEWQTTYVSALEPLLEHFSDDLIRLRLVDLASHIDARAAVEDGYARLADEWPRYVDPDTRSHKLASAERNLVRDGVEDLRHIPPDEWKARVYRSAVYCDALDSLPERRAFNKFGPRIQLVFIRGPEPSIHVASCATSTSQFWVSEGVVDVRPDGRLLPRMLGHTSDDASFGTWAQFEEDWTPPGGSTVTALANLSGCYVRELDG